ncbi:MAG: glycosyltransferase family protein [Alphaproteobacteria bacterium]|nr:glycosyltransferase family protein [Alphaproteobacteria bacterium]
MSNASDTLQQALAAHQQARFDEAEKLYRVVLQAEPRHADALALLGLVLGAKGQHEEAIASTTRAITIDPNAALLHFHHGSVLMNARRLADAVAAFLQSIQLQPHFVQAHYNMANALRALDDWSGAMAAYRRTLQLQPDFVEAMNNLALCHVHEKHLQEALDLVQQSVKTNPRYGEGWRTICNIAEQMKLYPLALEAGKRCTELMPDSHFSWFGYGVALCRLDRFEEAIDAYKRALALKPERADIWDNLAQTYQSLNRLEKAEVTFRKTVEVAGQIIVNEDTREVGEEEYGTRHWHLALMELLRGKYKPGFARYRARFKDVGGLKRPDLSRPLWRGEALAGKTLLVCDEQGFGDTLMFCRYLPLLRQQGVRIILSVHPVLEPLFNGWEGADTLIVHGMNVPAYDYYCSVFDLPHRMGTTLETVPHETPYLPVLPVADENRLTRDGAKPMIGVVWGGSPLHLNDGRRSVPLELFAQLFAETGATYFSLNRDMKPGDAEKLPGYKVTDLAPRLKNFAVSSQFVRQMDLIITCDTATAHLAGGMGKETWVLLPFAPDWRWLTERTDSVWYPHMRLFRQPRSSDWASVVADVREALNKKLR